MEAGFVVLVIVLLCVGIIIGIAIERSKTKKVETQGVIYAYFPEPGSAPALLLEYSVSIDDIASRKRVLFDVTVVK